MGSFLLDRLLRVSWAVPVHHFLVINAPFDLVDNVLRVDARQRVDLFVVVRRLGRG